MVSHLLPFRLFSLFVLILAGLLAGCAFFGATQKSTPTSPGQHPISEGYTQLYDVVTTQKYADELLLIKIESDDVDALINQIADYAATLEKRLKKLAAEDPAIHLDLKLQEVKSKTSKSVLAERLKNLLSTRGKNFERLLLLTQSSLLNDSRHLAKVMREMETSENRKVFWEEVQQQFDDQYQRVEHLLETQYFCQ